MKVAQKIVEFLWQGCLFVLGWLFLITAFSFFLGRDFLDVNPFW
jgi:hypothetical protein